MAEMRSVRIITIYRKLYTNILNSLKKNQIIFLYLLKTILHKTDLNFLRSKVIFLNFTNSSLMKNIF